jgi:hypothetical protein
MVNFSIGWKIIFTNKWVRVITSFNFYPNKLINELKFESVFYVGNRQKSQLNFHLLELQ